MLTREALLRHGSVLAALLGFVLLLSDRGPFAWTLAGAVFVSVLVGDLRHRRATTERGRWD